MSGAGFIRRFGYFPGTSELTAIEGVVIVDSPPVGSVAGVGTGCVAVVGECVDQSYACKANSSGLVSRDVRPVEVFGGADLVDKIGGFDSELGDFGDEMGNLYVELRNKAFRRLVVAPVDLLTPASGSTYGVRMWRDLPTNTSATDITPITAVLPALVKAGTEFRLSTDRVKLAQKVQFTAKTPKVTGIDGVTEVSSGGWTGGPPVTNTSATIVSAGSDFTAAGVSEGDIVVVGSLAAASGQNLVCAGAGMLRVVSVDSSTQITVQKLNGAAFTNTTDWQAGSALAFRVHYASDADTGADHQYSESGGYTVLAMPVTASIARRTSLSPLYPASASSASSWEALSGLTMRTHYTGDTTNGLTYTSAIQAPNVSLSSGMRTRYQASIDALLNDDDPTNIINFVTCARKDGSGTLKTALKSHCLTASSRGLTRSCLISPSLSTQSLSAVIASSGEGVGVLRNERIWFSWPGAKTFVPEASGISLATADSSTTTDGILDTTMDTWLACLLSWLPPEVNPGVVNDVVERVFAPILGYARGTPKLDLGSYILLKQYGVAALRMTRENGPIIQSGITSSLTAGEKNINRRRMADFIQDSLAARYVQMSKQLATSARKDALASETDAFLADLLSENNPAAQRIESYLVDDKSANTPTLSAAGVHIIISKVRMLAGLDTIVAQVEVSPDTVTVRT